MCVYVSTCPISVYEQERIKYWYIRVFIMHKACLTLNEMLSNNLMFLTIMRTFICIQYVIIFNDMYQFEYVFLLV